MQIIDYLNENNFIDEKEFEIACSMREAFQKQRSISISFNYEKIFVDGGRQDPAFEIIFNANRDWAYFSKHLRHLTTLIELFLTERNHADFELIFSDKLQEKINIFTKILRRLKVCFFINIMLDKGSQHFLKKQLHLDVMTIKHLSNFNLFLKKSIYNKINSYICKK